MSSDSSQGPVASLSHRKRSSCPERRNRASPSSGAGQMATTALIPPAACAAAWIAWNPPMLEPRRATRGACARSSSAIASASSNAPGPKLPSERPWPRASYAKAAMPSARQPRAKSKWLSLAEPAPCRITTPTSGCSSGRKSAYASPSWRPSSGAVGVGCRIGVLHNRPSTMSALAVSHVYPLGSRLNERGRLEVGGCDVIELAAEFGTPAYVYAEDDMRARGRGFVEAFRARTEHFEVIYASKAFPCTAVYRLFADGGLSADVASGGELHLALAAGMDPERLYMHGNNKSPAELDYAIESGIGHIVVDSFDEVERLRTQVGAVAPRGTRGRAQRVLLRVTPGIEPSTHEFIQTGQVDSKFGFQVDQVERAVAACADAGLELCGLHAHIGSQILDVDVFEKLGELLAGMGDWPLLNLGGGLGIAYTADDRPPSIEEYVEALLRHAPDGVTVLCEPGRALVGNAGVTIYTVGAVKRIPDVRTYVAVDGGMSDNLRPMLYGARYEAEIADRLGGDRLCTIAGKHCESGDILVRDVNLDDPRPGDVLVIPATGAYGHAMANNYNGVPRPPVIFCSGGDARTVIRRETYDDLTL